MVFRITVWFSLSVQLRDAGRHYCAVSFSYQFVETNTPIYPTSSDYVNIKFIRNNVDTDSEHIIRHDCLVAPCTKRW